MAVISEQVVRCQILLLNKHVYALLHCNIIAWLIRHQNTCDLYSTTKLNISGCVYDLSSNR